MQDLNKLIDEIAREELEKDLNRFQHAVASAVTELPGIGSKKNAAKALRIIATGFERDCELSANVREPIAELCLQNKRQFTKAKVMEIASRIGRAIVDASATPKPN